MGGTVAIDDILLHYGVKGMKWGIRKSSDRDRSTETRQERKASSRNLNNYMWRATMNEPMFRTMSKDEYDALRTKGETYAKNTTLKRVTPNANEVLKGATYVSKLQSDSDFYKAALPAVGPNAKGFGAGRKEYKQAHYELQMKATAKLSVPSEKERVDAFMELLSEPAIHLKGKKAPITGRQYLEKNGYKKIFGSQTDQELAFRAYYDFVQGQGNKDAPLNKPYFDKLLSKGYNATIDENDQGTFTKNPLILLKPEGTVEITSVRRLTTDEINQAQRKLAAGS